MKPYFLIYKSGFNELTIAQKVVYAVLSGSSDYKTFKTSITREGVVEESGEAVKDEDTVTDCARVLAERNIISFKKWSTPDYKDHITYTIKNSGDFVLIRSEIFKLGLSKGEIALYLSLATKRYKNTNVVSLTNIYQECGMAKATYYKYIEGLKNKGLVYQYKQQIILKKLIYGLKSNVTIEQEQFYNELDQTTKTYKLLKWFFDNEIQYTENASRIFDKFVSGAKTIKTVKTKETFNF